MARRFSDAMRGGTSSSPTVATIAVSALCDGRNGIRALGQGGDDERAHGEDLEAGADGMGIFPLSAQCRPILRYKVQFLVATFAGNVDVQNTA